MADDLKGVINQLQKNQDKNTVQLAFLNDQVAMLQTTMTNIFKGMQRSLEAIAMDKLESSRETSRNTNKIKSSPGKKIDLPPLLGLSGILASIGAVTAAISGLRGWEVSALKNIKSLSKALMFFPVTLIPKVLDILSFGAFGSFTKYITFKLSRLKFNILKFLGFDLTLKKFNQPGSGLKTPLTTQILNGLKSVKAGLLANLMFSMGLNPDGSKMVVKDSASGKFKAAPINIANRFMRGINTLLYPIRVIATGIEKYIAGPFAKTLKFLGQFGLTGVGAVAGPVGKATGGVLRLAGRILWPLGILFSAFTAFDTFIKTEGSTYEKTKEALKAFIGDFLGAPLDLIKTGFVKLLKFLGIGVNKETGEIDESTYSGAILKYVEDFSFVDLIKSIVGFPFKVFEKLVEFVKDPVGVAKETFNSIKGMIKNFFKALINFFNPFKKEEKTAEELSLKSMNIEKYDNKKIIKTLQKDLEGMVNRSGRGLSAVDQQFYDKVLSGEITKFSQDRFDRIAAQIGAGREIGEDKFRQLDRLIMRNQTLSDGIIELKAAIEQNAANGSPVIVGGDNNSTSQTNHTALDANPTISKDASDNSGLTNGFDLDRN
tara:strand:- start:4999 stop:6801 length:1803 start_codon:yes stop_codon:yes gene_type:complete